MGEAVSSKI